MTPSTPGAPLWRVPGDTHGAECPPARPCHIGCRTGSPARSSLCHRVSSAKSGSQSGVLRLIANHLTSFASKTHQKSGSFPPPALPGFSGTTTLSDSRTDRCLAAPLRPLPSSTHGSPPLTRSPVSTCCAPYPGGPVQVHLSAASPNRAAFPVLRPGRRPQLPFRGLLRLYTRYGPSIRSTARSGLCRRASTRTVTHPSRLPATGPTDHCPGGTSTHEVIAPFGAHQRSRRRR